MSKANSEEKSEINKFWERLGIPVCSLNEARRVVELAFDNKQVPCLIGEAGIGKSQLWKQIAEDKGWDIVYFYLAHLEREDIGGIPFPATSGAYEFLCEASIKRVIDSNKPTLVVFDEWNRGDKTVMNAAFTVMEARRFGSYQLPDHVFVGTAMNPSEANYLVNEAEKDPAFRRRLIMMAVQSNITSFLEHARGRGKFHSLVCDFLETQPQCLNDTASRDAGKVYSNPAAWEKISDGLRAIDQRGEDLLGLERTLYLWGSGIVGMGIMGTFMQFLKESASLINPDDVLRSYDKKAKAKVQRLVEKKRNDAIMEVCESVALSLISRRDEPEIRDNLHKVAGNIGKFLKDLTAEATMAFLTKWGKHANDAGETAMQFYLEANEELSQIPEYQNAIQRINSAHEKVESEMGISSNKGKKR